MLKTSESWQCPFWVENKHDHLFICLTASTDERVREAIINLSRGEAGTYEKSVDPERSATTLIAEEFTSHPTPRHKYNTETSQTHFSFQHKPTHISQPKLLATCLKPCSLVQADGKLHKGRKPLNGLLKAQAYHQNLFRILLEHFPL